MNLGREKVNDYLARPIICPINTLICRRKHMPRSNLQLDHFKAAEAGGLPVYRVTLIVAPPSASGAAIVRRPPVDSAIVYPVL
jgi:hypothetical protein